MLTKNDLTEIRSIMHDEIDTVVEGKLKPVKDDLHRIDAVIDKKLMPLKVDLHRLDTSMESRVARVVETKLKPIKKDLRWLKKTLDIVARNYDEGDVKLERRVTKIEKHLSLPQ